MAIPLLHTEVTATEAATIDAADNAGAQAATKAATKGSHVAAMATDAARQR